jgi:glutamyl-tRNA(Gln) amidotransferase subunit D
VVKLRSGYNIGLLARSIEAVTISGRKEAHYKIPEREFPFDPALPKVKLLGTGGTIASRLDYRTGAVIPAFSPGELYGSVPELADICNLETEKLFGVFSENMGPEQYLILAEKTGEAIREGYDGIVIGHGTDTMHHTAAALSFMVQKPPVPIIMVGSQRSSDRPSSDAAQNLINATWAAGHGPIAEVLVCMFGPTSDLYNLLHRGTRVRKMHSSVRSTFRTLGDIPVGMVEKGKVTPFKDDWRPRREDRGVTVRAAFDERVTLVYYYPGMRPDVIDALVEKGYRGIVIAGTGLGHVNRLIYPALDRAREAGVQMYMTLQTLWGFVQMNVYETGREILELGVVPLANMLPEVAYIKLGWALGVHPDDPEAAKALMTSTIAGEMTETEPHDGYLIFQGGIPEIQEFLGRVWR